MSDHVNQLMHVAEGFASYHGQRSLQPSRLNETNMSARNKSLRLKTVIHDAAQKLPLKVFFAAVPKVLIDFPNSNTK